jgi:hypothetical protein
MVHRVPEAKHTQVRVLLNVGDSEDEQKKANSGPNEQQAYQPP